jgi:ATP-dependent DNA helicase Rep
MQARVSRLLAGKPSQGLTISTFHALGVRILREEARQRSATSPNFSILDSTDCFGIVSELAGSVDKATIRKLQSLISNWKSALVSPDEARKDAQNDSELSPPTLSQLCGDSAGVPGGRLSTI